MKHLFCLALAISAFAQSPAETAIRTAETQIAQHPEHAAGYSALAMAYARRARETSDVTFYEKAEATLRRAPKGDFEAEKIRVWLMLGRHDFAAALDAATKLNKQAPDDVTVYGFLVDANTELGNYSAAVKAAQWMLNLRPGNVPGLTRAAYLREIHGDVPGALELMRRAYDSTPVQQAEDRAWLLVQISHLQLVSGDLVRAEEAAKAALATFSQYHYALGALANVRLAQHRETDAVELLQRRYESAPHAENLYALAAARRTAGLPATEEFAAFEKSALAESTTTDNANHELIEYYTDVFHQPDQALSIARAELARRRDIHTLDAYAWALAAAGQWDAAGEHIRQALATGTKDPKIVDHARRIRNRLI